MGPKELGAGSLNIDSYHYQNSRLKGAATVSLSNSQNIARTKNINVKSKLMSQKNGDIMKFMVFKNSDKNEKRRYTNISHDQV